MFRSSRSQMFFKIVVLEHFSIFTGKRLCWSLFLLKLRDFRSEEHLRWLPQYVVLQTYICHIFRMIKFSTFHCSEKKTVFPAIVITIKHFKLIFLKNCLIKKKNFSCGSTRALRLGPYEDIHLTSPNHFRRNTCRYCHEVYCKDC